jgi:hypothetical protein
MELERIDTGLKILENGDPPFSSSRLLLADFNNAQLLLMKLLKKTVPGSNWLFPSSHMVIHAMEKNRGGLEHRRAEGF